MFLCNALFYRNFQPAPRYRRTKAPAAAFGKDDVCVCVSDVSPANGNYRQNRSRILVSNFSDDDTRSRSRTADTEDAAKASRVSGTLLTRETKFREASQILARRVKGLIRQQEIRRIIGYSCAMFHRYRSLSRRTDTRSLGREHT